MTSAALLFGTFGLQCAAAAADPRTDDSDADRSAMERLSRGDVDALGELYDRHHAAVRRLAVRMSPRAGDGDDIVHATFLNAMKSAGSFDPARSVRAWLLGIAARLMQRERVKGARWARLLRASFRPPEPTWTSDPERALAAREGLTRVERALEALAEPKRLVLVMAEIEGLSGEEIADALEIPIGTVWTRLHHARRELAAAVHGGLET